MKPKMKLTFIGAGNMGGAAAIALAKAFPEGGPEISVTARHTSTFEKFKDFPITTSRDNCEAVRGADIVVLVVKPWLVESVVEEIKPVLDYTRQIVVCMAAGVETAKLLQWLDKGDGVQAPLAYVIPNTAIEVMESMTFIAPVTTSEEQTKLIKTLFDAVGSTFLTDEKHLGAGTALASCGIAYALRYIRAATEGGVELGFKADDAQKIVSRTVRGAAAILEAHGTQAEQEIDKVTTPGGITIKGLNAMEDAGFTPSVIRGLKASK